MGTATKKSESGIIFSQKLVYASSRGFGFDVTDDTKAFELRFVRAMSVGVGSPKFDGVKAGKSPMSSKTFSAIIGARGKAVRENLAFNGFLTSEPGTNVAVIVIANDVEIVKRFRNVPEGKDFTFTVPVKAQSLSEIRVAVWLTAQREDGGSGSAIVALSDIGCETFRPKKQKTKSA